jgi:signal transduction histidine kinase
MTIRVLFVDDELELLQAACDFACQSEPKIELITATSAEEALKMIEGNGIEAIISDYQMDFMDGLELLEICRKQDETIPFIIYTRRSREEIAIQALNLGATFYLKKDSTQIVAQFHELCNLAIHAVEKRRAEYELHEIKQKLETLTEQRDELNFFAKTVAHDLHNKLASLSMYNALEPNPSIYTKKIDSVVVDMVEFLDNLLHLARVGKKATYNDKVDLYQVVDKVIKDFAPFAQEIDFVLHPLPVVKGHYTQLEQIFHNLLINVIRHAEAKKVTVWHKRNTHNVKIFIRDDGKGIAPFYQQRIRAMWNKHKLQDISAGIGLLIVKKVVEDHGGAIAFSSGYKNGTTFRITLPLERVLKE